MYIKTDPTISFAKFKEFVLPITNFKSLNGREYKVLGVEDNMMNFIRMSSGKKWAMDLIKVHQAYLELMDFRTENFRPFVPRTHSPALGLLLHLGLLKR
ncbi:hypothetical protein [Pedobacter boryungensis]|uniref:Uncharacterized protein n=1 Tax=Pedobacter boryungensis TaxID=869962 RepID=A0ABX2D988_9SPHI|nr:hypothetical protein [Pedobacter boryungensis]NQX30582.1 hypothetical protein [Pedobacter boryungensis]